MDSFIECKDVSKVFENNSIKTIALHDVSFSIKKGSFVVILGPSGAGKTTLLNLLGGMDSLTSGSLKIDGDELFGLSNKSLTLYRRKDVGFIFQFYNLMPNLTALENVELATEVCKDAYPANKVLADVGLIDKSQNFPSQLSGGQQQRVSIARAIAKNPKLLLCDEPTGALDSETGKSVLKVLLDLASKDHKTVIVVTHNSAIKGIADQVINIKNGTIKSVDYNDHPQDIEEIVW